MVAFGEAQSQRPGRAQLSFSGLRQQGLTKPDSGLLTSLSSWLLRVTPSVVMEQVISGASLATPGLDDFVVFGFKKVKISHPSLVSG